MEPALIAGTDRRDGAIQRNLRTVGVHALRHERWNRSHVVDRGGVGAGFIRHHLRFLSPKDRPGARSVVGRRFYRSFALRVLRFGDRWLATLLPPRVAWNMIAKIVD